ncbi:3TM-type holin [Chromobacterium alticapitis]|uniref:Holin of 3TMs, for gene-transfer release n=1 Tax=Chromobacterium alticapitis TaxID=2073169 RepID=A0A2S5DH04_9NEIS|nr:3TM-type holin [Chromobacterium alticapitis]POZ62301.1 hypothetical protein C2I19_09030 [Chromobacterium alticapitis]
METPPAAALDRLSQLSARLEQDARQREEMRQELLRLLQAEEALPRRPDTELPAAAGDARSAGLFESGWRPYCGWVCGAGLSYQFLLRPVLNGLALGQFPPLEVDTLMTLLFGMLGLGVYRTIEKVKR